MIRINFVYIFIVLLSLVSCDRLTFDNSSMLAIVGEETLYIEEVNDLITKQMSKEDSTLFISDYVEKWVKLELKRGESERLFTDRNIEKMVDDYRQSLLAYKFDQKYSQHISENVSTGEVLDFYEAHKSNFSMDAPLVKAYIVRFPKGYKGLRAMKKKFYSFRADDMIDIGIISNKEEFPFYDYSKRWYYFDEIVDCIPYFSRVVNADNFIAHNRQYEYSNKEYTYLMHVREYRRTGSALPLELVEQQIKKNIINNRKVQYLNHVTDSIYKDALIRGKAINTLYK